jgi:hypothetical protein
MKTAQLKKNQERTKAEAHRLLRDEAFLYRAMTKIGELGVVGEERNRLILFLAGLTKDFDMPISVIVKGQSSSGKSNLIRKTTQIFPPESVIARASLSAKAPVHGEGSLKSKILYLYEYRGGKDAQYLLRLQQSEKAIAHEFTTMRGAERETKIAERVGSPVIFTTTTEGKVFVDDETRFLSIWIDDSPQQSLAVMQAQLSSAASAEEPGLPVWHEAARLVGRANVQFSFPLWFNEVAKMVPKAHVRVRRDWERFLTFCKIVAVCRSFSIGPQVPREFDITFSDYCVTHCILNAALASSAHTLHERELALADAVRTVQKSSKRPVTIEEVADHLNWKESLVYKYVEPAVEHKLIRKVSGTRQSNKKLLESVPGSETGFLPSPERVAKELVGLKLTARFIDPISGKPKEISA